MKAYAQTGNTAANPYYFSKFDIMVHTMEELCYVLKEEAFLLGNEIMDKELIAFVGEECGLQELARELNVLVSKKGTLSSLVSMIQSYVGFYTTEEIRQMEETLKKSSGMSDYEKKKLQIDYLVEKKRYSAAADAYERLLKELYGLGPEIMQKYERVTAGIWHNKGVAFAGMMRYDEAGECFLKAFELTGDRDSFLAFLGAKRLILNQTDYVALTAAYGKQYADCLAFEKSFDKLSERWQQTGEYAYLKELRSLRVIGEQKKYYSESEKVVGLLKTKYRNSVGV